MSDLPDSRASIEATAAITVYELRGERVVLDFDVARLFAVETRRLNEQVNRNQDKFLDDFAFRLTREELDDLKSQIAMSSSAWGGARHLPRAFTEHGVVMAATVLKSPRAIDATRHIVRTFVASRREAWERDQTRRREGALSLPLDPAARQGLMSKLNSALSQVLDAIVDQQDSRTVRDEAKAIATEGLNALKAYLKTAGINNERTLAEVRRIMAEAEGIEVDAARKRTENEHRQLALLAKKLKLVIQAQQYAETGSIDGLMAVLSDLERP